MSSYTKFPIAVEIPGNQRHAHKDLGAESFYKVTVVPHIEKGMVMYFKIGGEHYRFLVESLEWREGEWGYPSVLAILSEDPYDDHTYSFDDLKKSGWKNKSFHLGER